MFNDIKRSKKAYVTLTVLAIVYLVYVLAYKTYFGWNVKPISEAEIICDQISHIIISIMIFCYFFILSDIMTLHVRGKIVIEEDKPMDCSCGFGCSHSADSHKNTESK